MPTVLARGLVVVAVFGAVGCSGSDASTGAAGSSGASGSSSSSTSSSGSTGSSGSSGNGGGSCSFAAAPPPYAAGDTSTVQGFAEDEGRARLERLFGRWLRRDAVVYGGTVSAQDNQGLGQPPPEPGQAGFTDQTIPSQPAFATLESEAHILASGTTYDDAKVLSVHGTTTHQYVPLSQVAAQPGLTIAGIILGDTSTGGNTGTCTSCAPSFSALPAKLAIAGLDATRVIQVTDGNGQKSDFTLHIKVDASLDAVEPCALSFDDLIHANGTFDPPAFVANGNEMVWQHSGTAPMPAASKGVCGGTAYTIDLYVNRTNLADYGVRNFQAGKVGVICPP